jgi:hypothetical protein
VRFSDHEITFRIDKARLYDLVPRTLWESAFEYLYGRVSHFLFVPPPLHPCSTGFLLWSVLGLERIRLLALAHLRLV